MTLNFPDNPSDGDQYTAENGVTYTYNASIDAWTGSSAAGDNYWKETPDGTALTTVDATQNLLLGGTLGVAGNIVFGNLNIGALTALPEANGD